MGHRYDRLSGSQGLTQPHLGSLTFPAAEARLRWRTFAKSRPAISTATVTATGRQLTACLLGALLCALAVSVVRADEAAPTISPAKALQRLLDGNRRYASDRAERPHQRPSDAPQHPFAVILSCSDSRVSPEIIFDQGVGSLFVVRVAGNTYDRLALQSIEYAVGHLGTPLIIVIGHDQCGAVTAAVKAYPDPRAGPMLANIYPAVSEARGQKGDELSNAIDDNAVLIAKRLEHEPELAKKVASGQLKIQPARYGLKTGRVRLLK